MYKKEIIEEYKFKDGSYMRLIKFMRGYIILEDTGEYEKVLVGKALENPFRKCDPPEALVIDYKFFSIKDIDKAYELYDSLKSCGEIKEAIKQSKLGGR